ncbi:DUF2441 domain-containing protein [Sutcliffiella horikoshii]|uniref:DUF2441 domain-containing protein n=1 Tax=Sutcliffiella horikoshii TaxID=79883 RepID=UPI003CED87E1
MEFVEDKIFYHIQRRVNYHSKAFWLPGETLFIGNEKNPFMKAFDLYGPVTDDLINSLGHYQRLIREFIFEEIRKEFFSNLPSRQKCLWVIPNNIDIINYWWKQIYSDERVLLKVSLTGKIHQVNQRYLKCNFESLDYNREQAFRYWTGSSEFSNIENEILFEGHIRIVEVLNSPEELY